jgi:hypothetical protein
LHIIEIKRVEVCDCRQAWAWDSRKWVEIKALEDGDAKRKGQDSQDGDRKISRRRILKPGTEFELSL